MIGFVLGVERGFEPKLGIDAGTKALTKNL